MAPSRLLGKRQALTFETKANLLPVKNSLVEKLCGSYFLNAEGAAIQATIVDQSCVYSDTMFGNTLPRNSLE